MSAFPSTLDPIHAAIPHSGDLLESDAADRASAPHAVDTASGTGRKCIAPGGRFVPMGLRRENMIQGIRRRAHPLTGAADDYNGLLEMIGDANIVFLGGASHGTREFHRQRARITKRLILEKGFNAVAVDADWLEACRLNRLVNGVAGDLEPMSGIAYCEGFPSWMWRNDEVLDFIRWLGKHHANARSERDQVGVHGLDLYSHRKSMTEILNYLEDEYPTETSGAKRLFCGIDRFGREPQNYGLLAGAGLNDGCRAKIIRHLAGKRMMEAEYLTHYHPAADDAGFLAAGIDRLRNSAEFYYRKLFRSYVSSWNLRAEQMMEMLVDLIARLQSTKGRAKIVVWAHNSQIGDARATELALHGEWNLGHLVRETMPCDCKLIGFTTYAGTVTASTGWGLAEESMELRPGIEGGCESMFHHSGVPNFWLDLTQHNPLVEKLAERQLERAIGVVYRPGAEGDSVYFETSLARQFDAVIHFDITHATAARTGARARARERVPEIATLVPC